MKIVLIVVIWILALYFLRKIFYLIHVFINKKSKEVELIINFIEDKEIVSKKAIVITPFYNEENAFHFGVGLTGIQIGLTPTETVPRVLQKVFENKDLVQVCIDGLFYPSDKSLKEYYRPEKVYENMKKSFDERGIQTVKGAFLYNQESIKKGSLEYGISDGMDLFYICNKINEDNLKGLMGQVEEWQKMPMLEAYNNEKKFLDAEGELFHQFEAWQIVHCHDEFLLFFVNEIFKASVEKFFKINKILKPTDFVIPAITDIFKNVFNFSGKPHEIKMYLEDNNFIIYREQEKDYETWIKALDIPKTRNKVKEILSYFIPSIIGKKAYSKRRLLRYGVQFFFLAIYLVGIILGLNYLMFEVLKIENMFLLAISCFAAPLLGVTSLVLSIYYSFKGIFGKAKFVRVGI